MKAENKESELRKRNGDLQKNERTIKKQLKTLESDNNKYALELDASQNKVKSLMSEVSIYKTTTTKQQEQHVAVTPQSSMNMSNSSLSTSSSTVVAISSANDSLLKLQVENAVQANTIQLMTTYSGSMEQERIAQRTREDKQRQDERDRDKAATDLAVQREKDASEERKKSLEGLYGLLGQYAPK